MVGISAYFDIELKSLAGIRYAIKRLVRVTMILFGFVIAIIMN